MHISDRCRNQPSAFIVVCCSDTCVSPMGDALSVLWHIHLRSTNSARCILLMCTLKLMSFPKYGKGNSRELMETEICAQNLQHHEKWHRKQSNPNWILGFLVSLVKKPVQSCFHINHFSKFSRILVSLLNSSVSFINLQGICLVIAQQSSIQWPMMSNNLWKYHSKVCIQAEKLLRVFPWTWLSGM